MIKFNAEKFVIGCSAVLLLSGTSVFAAEQDSLEIRQKSLLEKLDSLNDAVLGLRVGGTAKAGVLASMATSDQFSEISPTQENQAYTDVNFVVTARPSSETEVRVETRLHKDWQSAYEENNNPVIGHWFSYDGKILDNHLDFNLGYMRVGYTPYTLFTPQPEILQEPEIFAASRVEALSKRNLDTTSRRLLQGINADFHSGSIGALDDIHAQVTGARLRNISKKNDQIFFDFDWSDRYMYGGRLGLQTFGATLGVNYVEVFDRELTTHSHDMEVGDTIFLDDNKVFSAELGFSTAKMMPDLPLEFGFFGEYAMSWWNANREYLTKGDTSYYQIKKDQIVTADGLLDSAAYVAVVTDKKNARISEEFGDDNGASFYVEPFIKGNLGGLQFQVKGRYLQNDEKFWSEMASSPVYRSNKVILNANALYADSVYSSLISSYGMSSLENLYYQVYNSNPLNATNIATGSGNPLSVKSEESSTMYSQLYNNYKNGHFYRNGYHSDTQKRLEAAPALASGLLDPSVNLALPYGIATPDRKGFAVSLDLSWNEAVELNGRFAQYSQDVIENTFTQYAAGLGVDVGRLLNLDRKLLVQGSYDHAEEDAYFQRKADKIIAGATLDVWGPLTILAGYEKSTKEYGIPVAVSMTAQVTKAEESLLRVGPRIKIAPASYLSLQYGLLTDKVQFNRILLDEEGVLPIGAQPDELSIDKTILMADVTVNF